MTRTWQPGIPASRYREMARRAIEQAKLCPAVSQFVTVKQPTDSQLHSHHGHKNLAIVDADTREEWPSSTVMMHALGWTGQDRTRVVQTCSLNKGNGNRRYRGRRLLYLESLLKMEGETHE